MKRRARINLTLEVDLDMVPGWGYQAKDFVSFMRSALKGAHHYNPVLSAGPIVEKPYIWDDKRGVYDPPTFPVLDDVPGDRLYAYAAAFANCERLSNEDTDADGALSLKEVQKFGTDMLNILDGETVDA